jgi:anti-sigma factor RsiW
MNCAELETLLCDYVDGTLGLEQKTEVERHLSQCAACSEMVRDAAAAVAFMERVAEVEPPPELITRILFERSAKLRKTPERRGSLRATLGRLFEPVLQPRFAMGMAMTILSFSMLGRFAGINVRQLNVSDLDPVKVWESVDDRVHRTWARAVKFYESLRLVYEVRSRLRELTEQEDEAEAPRVQPTGPGEAGETRQESGKQTEPGRAPQDVPRGIIR